MNSAHTPPKQPKRRLGKSLGDAIRWASKPIYKKRSQLEQRIFSEWNLVVGDEIAGYSIPEKMSRRNGELCLVVAADSMAALTLQHQEPKILERIATYFGYRGIHRLMIQQKPHLFMDRFANIPSPFPVEKMQVALPKELTNEINRGENEELKEALNRLAEQFHARRKEEA